MKGLINFNSRFRILKGGKISLIVSALLSSTVILNAAPTGGTVTSGNATINQSGNITNINQSTQKASINWNDFSVKSNETVNFNQPNVNSITLNRVIGTEKSVIDGVLNANGQVWILNSNGILFGKNASVNTAGLLATTAQLSDADFQNGNYNFKNSSSNSVINLGTIKVQNSSYVILAGKEVQNGGNIEAVKGKVHLVGANEYSINLNGNSLVNLKVNKGVLDAMVSNSGNILANGGEIFLTTNAVDELLKGVVNNTGIIEANSLDGITGKVELFAHGGEVQVGGTITTLGGFVETSGKDFSISKGAEIKARKWLIDPTDITIDETLASTIENQLATDGGDVTIEAVNDINVDVALSNNTNKNNTLTLTADADNSGDGNINVNAVITVGAGDGINLNYGSNGSLTMKRDDSTNSFVGKINLDSTSVVNINNESYIIINGLESMGNIIEIISQGVEAALGGNYLLGANIDASDTSSWNSGSGWAPIGDNSTDTNASRFTGNFNGFGHIISNLTINRPTENYVGLFGDINNATISNVGIVGGSIKGNWRVGSLVGFTGNSSTITNSFSTASVVGVDVVGGLVGRNYNFSKIVNSYASGNVNGNTYIGGLVGTNNASSSISNSYALGNVTGTNNWIGGLAGYNDTATIENSYATGSIEGNAYIGGLIGTNTNSSTIENSYATGNVTGSDNWIGGLAGFNGNSSNITNSYATGNIVGNNSTGGLVGRNFSSSSITNSYATGSITGSDNVGGLVGSNASSSSITTSYAIGNVIGSGSWVGGLVGVNYESSSISNSYAIGSAVGIKSIGGLVGYNYLSSISNAYSTGEVRLKEGSTSVNIGGFLGFNTNSTVSNSFWDTQTSNKSVGIGGTGASQIGVTGLTTSELKNKSTFSDASWTIIGDNSVSKNAYPVLISKNGVTTWAIYEPLALTYTLSDVLTGYIYNGENQLPTTWTAESIFGSDYSSWLLGTDYNFIYNTNSITGFTNAGTYNGITVDILKDGFTEASSGNTIGKFIISPKTISAITGITATSKEYDGLTNASLVNSNALFTGMISGDNLSINSATGAFEDKNAGENKTVNISSIVLGGTDVGNYTLSSDTATTTANISKKALTISGTTASDKTYDGTTDVTENIGTLTGFVGSETVSASAVGTFGSANAGTQTATFVYTLENGTNGGIASNYSLVNTTDDATITKANATITANSDSKVYNGLSQTVSGFTASGLVNDETADVLDTITGATASGKNVGEYATTLSGTDNNYNLSFVDGKLTITKADATVTANSDSKVYNGVSQSVNGFTVSGLVNNETADVLDTITGATASGTNAGEYVTSLAGSDGNYNLTFVDGKLTITPKQITVNANNLSKIFGDNDPILTYIAQGMIENDTLDGLIQRVSGENTGEYAISKGTLANQNYNITFNNGIFTIKRDTTLDNAINSIANTTAVQIPKVEIIVPKIAVAPQAQPIVIASTGNQVNVMSQPIQNQNTTMVTMGELRANQDTNTPNGNSDIRVPVGDNSVIELINGGVNLPNGVEQQFFVVNTENNNI